MASETSSTNLNNNIPTKKVTALVVDDDEICRTINTAILRSQGFAACDAKNAEQAMDLFRSGKQFDVVFMDMFMPHMKSGIKATKELRAMGVSSMIIGIEINLPYFDVQEMIEAGFDRFYEKPMRPISAALLHQEFMNMN